MDCNKCCKDCAFFEERNRFCRRFPPQPVVISVKKRDSDQDVRNDLVVSKYPVVVYPDSDWCGEFQPVDSPEETLLEE
jgi:hypothetical protein